MRANPWASVSFARSVPVFSRMGKDRFRRFGGALLCAAGLLWPLGAAAKLTITEARLNNLDAHGRVEEATLLMNPKANTVGTEFPQFRLSVKVKADGETAFDKRYWGYTRVTFKSRSDDGKSVSVSVCTDTSPTFTISANAVDDSDKLNLFFSFETYESDYRKALESLPAGEYTLSIQAFYLMSYCKASTPVVSDPKSVEGILVWKPFQEVISATVNNGASAYLNPGEKFDLHFTLKNNRRADLVPSSYAGLWPASSAGVYRIEWLIADKPPDPTDDNHAPGMKCATPYPTDVNFAGTFSSALLKDADTAAAVPADMAFGTYNLYLRVFDYTATANCSTDYAISPVFEIKDAIKVEPGVRHIRLMPFLPQPQPPLTVGKAPIRIVWEVKFSHAVKGVDAGDFRLVTSGLSVPASFTLVGVRGDTYVVTAEIPAGSVGPDQLASARLDFVDDDSVQTNDTSRPVGGPGSGNGNATGETQLLKGSICAADNVIWCDDFERTVQGAAQANLVGNGWVASTDGSCSHIPPSGEKYQPDAGGCAGIDSDIKPYQDYANPRANGSRSMFNRWRQHTVTSEVIDLSGLRGSESAVELSYWVRRGDDVFAETPDYFEDYFKAEYLDLDENEKSNWQPLAAHRGTYGAAVAGEVMRPVFQLPSTALWSGFRLRFTQNRGDGILDRSDASKVNGYDYWFVDDVVLRRVDAPRYSGGFCDNFESPEASRKQWSFSVEDVLDGAESTERIGEAGITGDVYPTTGSPTHSMFLRWSYAVAASLRIDTRGMENGVPVSYVVQRGMKNPPKTINGAPVLTDCHATTSNEKNDFVSEYLGIKGNWKKWQTVLGNNAGNICGQNYRYSDKITDPEAQHENFRLRFRQLSFGGYQTLDLHYDYWLVDDVCIGESFPESDLALTKKRMTDLLLPGGVVTYVLRATNGDGTMRGNLQIVDTLPAGLHFHLFGGSGWFCEAAGQVVTCSWSGELAPKQSAPDLYIYAVLGETAHGTLTNQATLSSGAVTDTNPGNNTATDEGRIETLFFLFTKGVCTPGETVGAVASNAPCSRYDFGGLAGELRSGIHLTHVEGTGTRALAFTEIADTPSAMEFALHCLDPAWPPAEAVQAVFGASEAPSLSLGHCAGSDATSMPWSAPLAVTFEPGKATASGVYGFRYGDVGLMELHMRADGDNIMQGGSGAFVQKPAALVLKDAVCADGTFNPGATEADGARFCRAGQPFGLRAEAHSVEGRPTPNFGREDAPKGIFLEKTLMLPTGGHDPDLGLRGLGDFTNGVATTLEQTWTEVGILTLTPRLGDSGDSGMTPSADYLGAGDVPPEGRQAVTLGRFYPDHFRTEIGDAGRMECPPALVCPDGGFFYSGQPFGLSVKACLYGDETCAGRLANYHGAFAAAVDLSAWGARGSVADGDRNPPDADTNGGALTPVPGQGLEAARIPPNSFRGADGAGGLFAGRFRYAHTNRARPVAQSAIYLRAVEDGRDGVSSRRADAPGDSPEAGIMVARGRLRLFNQSGSDKANLDMPVAVQFWHCGVHDCVWASSTTDVTEIAPGGAEGEAKAEAEAKAKAAVSLHGLDGALPEVVRFHLGGGTGGIELRPRGAGHFNASVNLGDGDADNACNHAEDGSVEGRGAGVPWLRAWNGVCAQAQTGEADPAARGSFGIYSGESRRAVHSRDVP